MKSFPLKVIGRGTVVSSRFHEFMQMCSAWPGQVPGISGRCPDRVGSKEFKWDISRDVPRPWAIPKHKPFTSSSLVANFTDDTCRRPSWFVCRTTSAALFNFLEFAIFQLKSQRPLNSALDLCKSAYNCFILASKKCKKWIWTGKAITSHTFQGRNDEAFGLLRSFPSGSGGLQWNQTRSSRSSTARWTAGLKISLFFPPHISGINLVNIFFQFSAAAAGSVRRSLIQLKRILSDGTAYKLITKIGYPPGRCCVIVTSTFIVIGRNNYRSQPIRPVRILRKLAVILQVAHWPGNFSNSWPKGETGVVWSRTPLVASTRIPSIIATRQIFNFKSQVSQHI